MQSRALYIGLFVVIGPCLSFFPFVGTRWVTVLCQYNRSHFELYARIFVEPHHCREVIKNIIHRGRGYATWNIARSWPSSQASAGFKSKFSRSQYTCSCGST